MIRGTTPIHTFEIPFDVSLISDVRIIYYQDGAQVLWRDAAECELEGKTITIRLTQEETFQFDCKKGYVYIQLRIRTIGGEVLASDEIRVEVKRCLDNEVM